jgi:hypothetical protein
MAIRIARESRNEYLPELEAVAGDELGTLVEHPPNPTNLRQVVLNYTFRYLGLVRGREFLSVARLDPYEQIELSKGAAILMISSDLLVARVPPSVRPRRARSQ